MSAKFQKFDLSTVGTVHRNILAVTFSELLDLYCAAKLGKSAHLRDYRMRKWRSQFHSLPAWQLTPEHIAAMVAAMEQQGYCGSSINRDVADIAGCYAWALRRRHCPADFRNPTAEYERRPDKVRRVEVAPESINRLLAQSKLSQWPKLYTLIIMAMHSGARKGELTRLTWADVDFKVRRGFLSDTKADTPRRLLLTQLVVDALHAIRPCPCPQDSLVFCGRNPFKPHDFRRAWERCREDAGLPDLHFHDLRHVAAAHLLKSGNSLHCVAQILGHKDTRMLSRVYGHLDDGHLQAAVDASWGG